jgi:uncharacterized membrane protein
MEGTLSILTDFIILHFYIDLLNLISTSKKNGRQTLAVQETQNAHFNYRNLITENKEDFWNWCIAIAHGIWGGRKL